MAQRVMILGRRDFVKLASPLNWSGGSWQSSAPLTNLADHRPQFVAEAVDHTEAATQFTIDLGYVRKVGLFSFINLFLSSASLIQLVASEDGITPTFDSGVLSGWPADIAPASNGNWGVFTLSGLYNGDFYYALGMPRFIVPEEITNVRYITVTIRDTTGVNPVRIGCFNAWEIWEPPTDFAVDWSVSVLDDSEIRNVPFGSTYITKRGVRRRMSFGLNYNSKEEFLARQLDFTLVKGHSDPIVVLPFPEDTENLEKTGIYGLISADSPITNPFYALYQQSFQIDQLR